MSRAKAQTWYYLRSQSLTLLFELSLINYRIRSGLADLPALFLLLDQFKAKAEILEAHEVLVADWKSSGQIWPEPRLERLVGRRKKRLASFHARVSLALEKRLASLPQKAPRLGLGADGGFKIE